MKYLCTIATDKTINLVCEGSKGIEEGQYYYLEPAKSGTQEQNKAFHALCMEYFKSGQHSYDVNNFQDFKMQIKKHLGEGFECFIYASLEIEVLPDEEGLLKPHYRPVIFDAKTINDIPANIKNDPHMKKMIRGRLKSWSKYTKKERTNTIDNLIAEMLEAGVNTKKFQEIIQGME